MAQYFDIQKFLVPLPQILEFQLAYGKFKNGSHTVEIFRFNYVSYVTFEIHTQLRGKCNSHFEN